MDKELNEKVVSLSTAQLRALNWLEKNRDAGDGNIFCARGECWYGETRTNWRLVNSLLRLMLLSEEEDGYYVINEAGRRILAGLPPYRDAHGKYHETVASLFSSRDAVKPS